MSKPPPYVTVTSGMRGFFSVLMHWDEEGKFWEPWNTGIGSYETSEGAAKEARDWAFSEGLEYRP